MKNHHIKVLFDDKRTIIYSFIFLIVGYGHYYFMQMPIDSFRYIRHSVMSMLCMICFSGAILIFLRKKCVRADLLFVLLMIIVGLTNLISLIKGLLVGYAGVVEYKFMSLPMLIYGIINAYVFLLYPIEAYRPGYITLKRAFLLFLPTLFIILLYIVEIKLPNSTLVVFNNFSNFIKISSKFQILLRILILVYPVCGIIIMMLYRKNYTEWCKNNFASMENIDAKWLDDYIFANLVITLSCLVIVFSNNVRSVLMHSIIFLVFFLYGLYRVLYRKSPYPNNYFK